MKVPHGATTPAFLPNTRAHGEEQGDPAPAGTLGTEATSYGLSKVARDPSSIPVGGASLLAEHERPAASGVARAAQVIDPPMVQQKHGPALSTWAQLLSGRDTGRKGAQ